MSIIISKAAAFRAAVKIARSGDGLPGWGDGVALWPGGTLYATDGFALLRSLNAHDADLDEPLLVSTKGLSAPSKASLSYTLDLETSTLTEVSPRSQKQSEVAVSRTSSEDYPPIERIIATPLSEGVLPFDSIRAGAIADAYGLAHGIWVAGPEWTVSLLGVEEGDTILLAQMRLAVES
jgi:hypothetical protein